jgi:plasmid rolling circle replication initiator protein Rep
MAARHKRRAVVDTRAPEPLPLFSAPDLDPAAILSNHRLGTLDKARTLLHWATFPEVYRDSFKDVPRVSLEQCARILQELQKRDVASANREAAITGRTPQPAHLRPYINRVNRLLEKARAQQAPPLLEPIRNISRPLNPAAEASIDACAAVPTPYDIDKGRAGKLTWLKKQAEKVAAIFETTSDPDFKKRAERIRGCANRYGIKYEKATGKKVGAVVYRCRDRFCTTCQSFKAREIRGRVRDAIELQRAVWPGMVYAHLTLTCRNVPVEKLAAELERMSKAFGRMTKRKEWPAIGYVRFLEVTRGADGHAHPHYHVILALHPDYFTDRGADASYLPHDRWRKLWQEALGATYAPMLNIHVIRPTAQNMKKFRAKGIRKEEWQSQAVIEAVAELAKYPFKHDDRLTADPGWFLELCGQLRNANIYSPGGVFRPTMKAAKENRRKEKDHKQKCEAFQVRIVWFKWNAGAQGYTRMGTDESSLETKFYYAKIANALAGKPGG